MPIWVDADACPIPVKEILYRAAHRAQVVTTLVANQGLRVPPSPFIKTQQVEKGFDVADHVIAQQVQPGDLVITGDIPLATWVIDAGGEALFHMAAAEVTDLVGQHPEQLGHAALFDERVDFCDGGFGGGGCNSRQRVEVVVGKDRGPL